MDPTGDLAPAEPRPRRRRRALAITAFVAVAAVALGAGVLIGNHRAESHWKPLYTTASAQAATAHAKYQHWLGVAAKAQAKARANAQKAADLRTQVGLSVGSLDHPHFVIWNSCGAVGKGCALEVGKELIGGLPDTFTYHLKFHSNVPVTAMVMSTGDYVCWQTHTCAAHYVSWSDRRSLNVTVHLAEGCAGYLAVFTSSESGTLYPEISVTRNPAQHATGVCA